MSILTVGTLVKLRIAELIEDKKPSINFSFKILLPKDFILKVVVKDYYSKKLTRNKFQKNMDELIDRVQEEILVVQNEINENINSTTSTFKLDKISREFHLTVYSLVREYFSTKDIIDISISIETLQEE